MAIRTYPSYWMYKDQQNLWRWKYEAINHKIIAVSSESYHNRKDCEHSIDIMKQSYDSEVWLPNDLANVA